MKRNILYSITILLGLILGACSLEENPKFTYNSNNIFNSEATTEAAVVEMYGEIATLYAKMILIPTIPNGTMVARVKASEESSAAAYDVDPRGNNLATSYLVIYKMIDSSNRILVGMEKNTSLEDGYKERVIGHAHFIRGYAYYLLGSLWGRASIQLEPVGRGPSINRPLSSRVDIYGQAESDWLIAAEKLPEQEKIGYANKDAANAYLAKLYFMLASQKQSGLETSEYGSATELWNKVVEYGEKVKGRDFLEANYASLFGEGVSNSPEIIFQLNYTSFVEKGIQKNWNTLFGPYYYSDFTAIIKTPDSYRTVVMDRPFYDYHAGTHPVDTRMKVIYLTDYINKKDDDKPRVVSYPFVLDRLNNKVINGRDFMSPDSDPRNPKYEFLKEAKPTPSEKNIVFGMWTSTGYGQGAFNMFPYSGKGSNKDSFGKYDTNNVILYRNADLLLILADAYNELGNEAMSDNYIQKILDRATRTSTHEPERVPASMTQEQRREYIFFERMFELAGEPIVFEDVRRRGTEYLEKVIAIHNNSWFENYRYNLEKEKDVKIEFRAIKINDGISNDQNFLKKNLLLPIPQREITYNDNISQADQNFGYE